MEVRGSVRPSPVVITGRDQLLDIVYNYPKTEAVFRRYEERTKVCLLCEYLFSTLEEVARILPLNQEELLNELNEAAQLE